MKVQALAQTPARPLRAGYRPVFINNPLMDAEFYGAGRGSTSSRRTGSYGS